MADTQVSPNMGITVPVPLVRVGPAWAQDVQAAFFTTVDAHDHSAGKGVKVTPAGIQINADLPFALSGTSYNATSLRSARFTAQGSPIAGGADVGCAYVSGQDLWYNDTTGRQIRLTNTGAANFAFLSYPLRTPAIAGTFTILATDAFSLYYVDTSGGVVTVNLPATSALVVGRTYVFVDFKRNVQTNNITLVPNGADKINGIAANYVIVANGSYTVITTDGAGNWYSQPGVDPLNFTLPVVTTTPGANLFLQSQRTTANPGTAGDIVLNTPDKVGAGSVAFVRVQGNNANRVTMGGWNNTNGGGSGIWMDTNGAAPSTTNYALYGDGSSTQLNAPTNLIQLIGNSVLQYTTAFGIQLLNTSPQFGGGSVVLGIGNRATAPTSNPSGGLVAYGEGGALKARGSGGAITTATPSGTGTQNTQTGINDVQVFFGRTTTSAGTVTFDTAIPNNTTLYMAAIAEGRLVSGTGTVGDTIKMGREALFKNISATASRVGSDANLNTIITDTNMTTATIGLAVSGTNARITITAPTGEGATPTIDWQVVVSTAVD